jgi:hypothetical protein
MRAIRLFLSNIRSVSCAVGLKCNILANRTAQWAVSKYLRVPTTRMHPSCTNHRGSAMPTSRATKPTNRDLPGSAGEVDEVWQDRHCTDSLG